MRRRLLHRPVALALGERARVFGFDISKCAVRAAAKRYREIAFAVGSSFGIPFADAAADLVVNVFAPIVPEELARVVKPGGHLILAVPGERHLYGLKEILYEHPYENPYKETEYPGFTFLQRTAVAREITITDLQTMLNLFAMTPYYWKTGVEGGEHLRQTQRLETHIEFHFLVYQRNLT